MRQDCGEAPVLRPEEFRRQIDPTSKRDAYGNVGTETVRGRISFKRCIRAHRNRMREASTMHGFDPRYGVLQQCRDITRKILGARLIVHLAIAWESRQSIGQIPKARNHMAYRRHGKCCPRAHDDQRQWCTDDQPEQMTTHTVISPQAACEGSVSYRFSIAAATSDIGHFSNLAQRSLDVRCLR